MSQIFIVIFKDAAISQDSHFSVSPNAFCPGIHSNVIKFLMLLSYFQLHDKSVINEMLLNCM